jgi:Ca-activated chloride channel homolog
MRRTRRAYLPTLLVSHALLLSAAHAPARAQEQPPPPTAFTNRPNTTTPDRSLTPQSFAVFDASRSTQDGATRAPARHLFHVTVADRRGSPVDGVRREQLSATEGGEPREIVAFGADDVPTSVMFLLDTSGSIFFDKQVPRRLTALRESLSSFMSLSNSSNEYFVTAFNQSPQVLLDGSPDSSAVLAAVDRLASVQLRGQTALFDSLYLSLAKLASRPARKHVLVLVTDGQDNASRYTMREVARALKESDVIVYAVGIMDEADSPLAAAGRGVLAELVVPTGGVAFFPENENGLKASFAMIASELRHQYAVAVSTPESARAEADGWRGVRFRLAELRDAGGRTVKAVVRTRPGFYEPSAPIRR